MEKVNLRAFGLIELIKRKKERCNENISVQGSDTTMFNSRTKAGLRMFVNHLAEEFDEVSGN